MSQQQPPPQPPPPPPGGGAAGPPLPPDQERLWAMLAHLLSFVAAYLFLGFVAPLIVLLVFGPRSAFVRAFLLIGIPILIVLGIAYLVLVIVASVRANNGEVYRYPATIRFVR